MPSTVGVLKGVRGDFGWVFRVLTTLMTTLAIVALARHAFVTWSLSAPMALIVDAYSGTMRLLLGWAEAYLQSALIWIGGFIGWRPTLYPHWRDVFVVTALLGSGFFRGAWYDGERLAALKSVVSTVVVALSAAIVAGVLPLQSPNLAIQLLIAASYGLMWISILLLYWMVGLEWRPQWRRPLIFRDVGVAALASSAVAIPVIAAWLLTLAFGSVAGMGLAGLAVSIALFGVAMFVGSLTDTTPAPRITARTILGGFIGIGLFFTIDAGLKLLMG